MFFKNFKKTCTLILLSLFIMPFSVAAYSNYVIPGGENIGIELNSKGVMVVGLYKVNNTYPAKDAGLKVGDIITSIDDQKVSTISEMVSSINNTKNAQSIKIGYIRNNSSNITSMKLYKDSNHVYKTGLYVKDSITGIGTITFIDPNTKLFGALGHEIIERSTGKILEIKEGKIYDSTVTSVERSENGVPGEKNAQFDINSIKGIVKENTTSGIFGKYTAELSNKKLYKVAQPNEIKKGKASILTVLNDKEIKEYTINIIKINDERQKTKNILFEITDTTLLNKTGGIIQGMSGSPIIQGDYIVGAVTHVVVDNPTRGYGILITNMLEEAEN